MNPTDSTNEEALLRELGAHDELVARCARGDLSYSEFEKAYDNFYPRYPLDGHESDAEELQLLEKLSSRVALHREIWEQVLTKVTADQLLKQPATVAVGFIGSDEAVRRIRDLARRHLTPLERASTVMGGVSDSALGARWVSAGSALGVEVVAPYSMMLPSGVRVDAVVLVRRFGGSTGMLVVTDFAQVRHVSREFEDAGFGFAVLEEPDASEPFVLEEYADMLRDWTWTGDDGDEPAWLRTRRA